MKQWYMGLKPCRVNPSNDDSCPVSTRLFAIRHTSGGGWPKSDISTPPPGTKKPPALSTQHNQPAPCRKSLIPELHKWEEHTMATKRPSFLKRQKEQKRHARALEKREARRGRREARATRHDIPPTSEPTSKGFVEDSEMET
jgi:hypothetical protein